MAHPDLPADLLDPNRRSFLRWAVHGLGAVFGVILGFPALMYLIDPRNRKATESDWRVVDGIRLDTLPPDSPQQGVIRDVRRDAWTLYPNDVIGRVWVVKHSVPADSLHVFSTVCPHKGCSVNLATDAGKATGFNCPCHNGRFALDGEKQEDGGRTNPAPRPMDNLEWKRDEADPNRLLVRYKNFKSGEPTQVEMV